MRSRELARGVCVARMVSDFLFASLFASCVASDVASHDMSIEDNRYQVCRSVGRSVGRPLQSYRNGYRTLLNGAVKGIETLIRCIIILIPPSDNVRHKQKPSDFKRRTDHDLDHFDPNLPI